MNFIEFLLSVCFHREDPPFLPLDDIYEWMERTDLSERIKMSSTLSSSSEAKDLGCQREIK